MDWETERAGWGGARPEPAQLQDMLRRAREFAVRVNGIVQEETDAWAEEFQRSIRRIDDALRARAAEADARRAAEASGALNVLVTNGDECEDGWASGSTTAGRPSIVAAAPPPSGTCRPGSGW